MVHKRRIGSDGYHLIHQASTEGRIRNRKAIPTDNLFIASYTFQTINRTTTKSVIVAKFVDSIYGPDEIYIDLLSESLYEVPVRYYKAVHLEDRMKGFIYDLIPINIQDEYISQNQAEKILSHHLNSRKSSNIEQPKTLSKMKKIFKKPTQL